MTRLVKSQLLESLGEGTVIGLSCSDSTIANALNPVSGFAQMTVHAPDRPQSSGPSRGASADAQRDPGRATGRHQPAGNEPFAGQAPPPARRPAAGPYAQRHAADQARRGDE